MKKLGIKYDAGKPRCGLVLGDFANALVEVSKIGTFGAKKYSDSGWKNVLNGFDRYTDAMLRHWLAHKAGEEYDRESGLPHLAHVAWNALAVLEFYLAPSPVAPAEDAKTEDSVEGDYVAEDDYGRPSWGV